MVEFKENELRSIPEESLSIGGADLGRPAMLAIGLRIGHSGELPFTAIGVFVDQNHQIVNLQIPLRRRPLLSLVQRRNVLFLPDVPEGVDAGLDTSP